VSEGCSTARSDRDSFVWVVKVWFEAPLSAGGEPQWRGNVKDVLTNEELYFQSLDELKEFLTEQLLPWRQ
jgi:hypothetical protein